MMSDIDKFELIDRYLSNSLSPAEHADFLQRMATDPAFAQETQMHQAANNLVIDGALLDLKAKMQVHYEQNYRNQTSPATGNRGIYAAVSAGAMLVAGGLAIWYMSSKQPVTAVKTGQTVVANENKTITTAQNTGTTEAGQVISSRQTPVNSEEAAKTPEQKQAPVISAQSVSAKPETQATGAISAGNEQAAKPVLQTENAPAKINENEAVKKPASAEKPKTQTEQVFSSPCANIHISAPIRAEASCDVKASGQIVIDAASVEGGKAPYTYSLGKGKSQSEPVFTALGPGTYTITVTDANGCSTTLPETDVSERKCPKAHTYSFAPVRETLSIPLAGNETELKIVSKSGASIFTTTLNLGSESFVWDGRTTNGGEVSAGYYLLLIRYADGNAVQGSVTVVK
ncbi:MAG: hypothetical protein V4543_04950 [Bacteroidota bacterium]